METRDVYNRIHNLYANGIIHPSEYKVYLQTIYSIEEILTELNNMINSKLRKEIGNE